MAIQELVSTDVPSVPQEFRDLAIWAEDVLRSHYEDLKKLREGLHSTSVVDGSPYEIQPSDQQIFVDTDGGDVTVNLPAGIDGKWYRIINVGSSGNEVTIDGGGSIMIGSVDTLLLSDSEALILSYNTEKGWW